MHIIHDPHRNRDFVLGACKRPDPHAPKLHLGNYVDLSALPPVPSTCDFSPAAMSVITNILGNDQYGDCVEAEDGHFIALVTGNSGSLFSYTTAMVLAAYTALTGFNPSDPNTDQGTDPAADMNYYTQHPYPDGTKLLGWAMVDATNQSLVQFAIDAFGNLKMWLALPNSYVSPFPSGNGFVWDIDTPNPQNGHCIGACGYNSTQVAIVGANSQGLQVMTWGYVGTITWRALAALCVPGAGGGLAVRVTPDWMVKATGKTPSGFAANDLISDFNKFFGGSLPVPAPPSPPVPPPGPKPTAPPTLAQAQAALAMALGQQLPYIQRSSAIQVGSDALTPLWP